MTGLAGGRVRQRLRGTEAFRAGGHNPLLEFEGPVRRRALRSSVARLPDACSLTFIRLMLRARSSPVDTQPSGSLSHLGLTPWR